MKKYRDGFAFVLIALLFPAISFAQISFTKSTAISDIGGHGLSAGEGPNGTAFSFYKTGSGTLALGEADGENYQVEDVVANVGGVTPTTQTESSLVFLSSTAYIFYRVEATGEIHLARQSGDSWATELISTNGGYPEGTVCGTKLCLCFKDTASNNLKFAEGTPGDWTITTVDNSSDDVGNYCDIIEHSSGDIYIAAYNDTEKLVHISQRANNTWSTTAITSSGDYGFWPHLVETPEEAVELRASAVKGSDTGESDNLYYYAIKNSGGSWSTASNSFDSFVGGYPAAVYANDKSFEFYRYLRYSAIFGNASYISYSQELDDGSSLRGVAGNLGTCLPKIRFLTAWFDSSRKVRLAYLQETNSCGGADDTEIVLLTSDALPEESGGGESGGGESGGGESGGGEEGGSGSGGGESGGGESGGGESGGGENGGETPSTPGSGEVEIPESPEELKETVDTGKGLVKGLKGKGKDSTETIESIENLLEQIEGAAESDAFTAKQKKFMKKLKKSLQKMVNLLNSNKKKGGNKKFKKTKKKLSRSLKKLGKQLK